MATFNGARFLPAQLASISAQTRPPDLLLVGDDGSTDETLTILEAFARTAPFPVTRLAGPGQGSGANFAALLARLPQTITHVALSDQDDVWMPDKLAVAMAALARETGPALYGARTRLVGADLSDLGLSPDTGGPPSFRHALLRNFAGGNTMVLNAAATDLIREVAQTVGPVPLHDWWIYQVVTGCGGQVVFDPQPRVLYRQHRGNLIGASHGGRAVYRRARHVLTGQHRRWLGANLDNLTAIRPRLLPCNRDVLDALVALRRQALLPRVRAFARTGLRRGDSLGQIGLWVALTLGRF